MKNKYAGHSDKELVELFGGAEAEAAFTEIYRRYSSNIHAYCLRILNDELAAEDIFQETFIRFYQNIKIDNQTTNVPGFLITIARNLCLNYKRDRRQMVSIEDIDFQVKPNEVYEKEELLDLITRALDLLELQQRELFVLREYYGMPYKDISDLTGISVASAKSKVFRAKHKIKNILAPYLKDLYQ